MGDDSQCVQSVDVQRRGDAGYTAFVVGGAALGKLEISRSVSRSRCNEMNDLLLRLATTTQNMDTCLVANTDVLRTISKLSKVGIQRTNVRDGDSSRSAR